MKNYKTKLKTTLLSNFLFRAAVLVAIKEFYLFLRNLYGLVVHPFKTVVAILKKPDWSQAALVFGLPVYGGIGALGAMVTGLVFLLFFQPTNELLVNLFFLFLAGYWLLVTGYSLYLAFWAGRYFAFKLKIKS